MKLASPLDRSRWSHGLGMACCALIVLTANLLATARTDAADRADEFLAGLRQRGWHDVALEYLATADQDPLATEEFLARVDFERGVTQRALAGRAASRQRRTALLTAAAASFNQFAAAHRESPLYFQALTQVGNLLTEQALFMLRKAEQLPASASSERETLQTTARKFLGDARQPLKRLAADAAEDLKKLPKAAAAQKNPESRGARVRLQGKQAEAQFLLAKIDFEEARTYASDSRQHDEALGAAAKAFAKLYKDYEEKLVGFYGRLYEGRCYQGVGKLDAALDCYEDLTDQPPIPNQDFRRLVARAYRHRAECHLAANKLDEAIKECNQWLDESQSTELKQPEWLAVAYQLAAAYRAKAAAPEGSRDASRLRSDARRLLRDVARHPNEFQREARAELATSGSGDTQVADVKTFDEAFTAGKDALERMNSSKLAARLAENNNPDAVEGLVEQAGAHQRDAIQFFQLAVGLADAESQLEELLSCRFYLCLLYWEDQRTHDAAIVGEFLARRFPEYKFAPKAAEVALAAYERLYHEARRSDAGDVEFESGQLVSMAELLVSRWPESLQAASAMNLLINIALRDDRLADAEATLARLPAGNRAGAELSLGGSLWTRYLQLTAGNDGVPSEEAAQLKQRAAELLAGGYEQLRTRKAPSASEATALLYFVQLLLADGQFDRAVEVLEDRSAGPLTLARQGAAAAQRAGFVVEAYKAALRAYVSVEPPRREEAGRMMTALESAVSGENSQQQLTRIYVSLGVQLQRQIRDLSVAGKADKARAVAEAFEDLLKRVTESGGAAGDWTIQNWIAQTSLQLGEGLRGEDAKRYFQRAEQAYTAILAAVEKDPGFAPSPRAVLGVRKRLGDCLRAQEQFSDAFDQYVEILTEKTNMLELQLAAATTLQQWGAVEKETEKLEQSIRGAMPRANKKNLVWGWLRLAAIADQERRKAEKAGKPGGEKLVAKYHDLFFQTRYNAAKARFTAAQLTTGDQQQKQLRTARQSVESMKRLYPNLGGPKWEQSYLDLLKEINAAISKGKE